MKAWAIICGVAPALMCSALWAHREVGVVAAVGLGVAFMVATRRHIARAVLGTVFSAFSAHLATAGRIELDAASGRSEVYALDGDPIDPLPPFITIRGYYRPQWTLDEYAVGPQSQPDQSQPPRAMLVPFLPNPQGAATATTVVLARIRALPPSPSDVAQIIGRTTVADPTLLTTVIQVEGDHTPTGIIVDTLSPPTARSGWIRLILAAVIAAVASAVFVSLLSRAVTGSGRSTSP